MGRRGIVGGDLTACIVSACKYEIKMDYRFGLGLPVYMYI